MAILPVVALILLAAHWETTRRPTLSAGIRAGSAAGALSGVVLLVVSLADGLATIGSAAHDPVYVREFATAGQPDLAAYVIGEHIAGGGYLFVFGAILGAVLGLAIGSLRIRG